MKKLILPLLVMIMIFSGCNQEQSVTKSDVSQINSTQLPSVSVAKQIIRKQTTNAVINSNDLDSIKSAPIDLKYAYYTANTNTANGNLRWYISATTGSLSSYIFSLGDIETINGTEKVSWREVSNNAASVNLTTEKVFVGNIADNLTHTFLDWGLGVEKTYASIQEDIELIRNTTVDVKWWFFQAPNGEWYIIDKLNHIYKFGINNGEYDWQVVDTTGETIEFYMEGGVKKIKILQTATANPGISISSVRGNTASYNAIAEFDVKLTAQPSADVIIPLSSSNENEGILDKTSLTFTVNNWDQTQTVIVKGQNQNVTNSTQDYTIVLAPAQSTDAGYNTFDANDVNMKGIELILDTPTDSLNFISLLGSSIAQNIKYTGNKNLSFSLVEKPDGMSIELNTGLIFWEAPSSTEGNSFTVRVRVTDGVLFSEIAFTVNVANSLPVPTQTDGNTVSVTDENSNLNGFKFRFLGESLSIPVINNIDSSALPTPQTGVVILSDYFYADDSNEGDIEILMPISLLPNQNQVPRLSVYHYTKEHGWATAGTNLRVEEVNSIVYAVISIGSLKGVIFMGLRPEVIGNSSSSQQKLNNTEKQTSSPIGITTANIHCIPNIIQLPGVQVSDFATQICTIDGLPNTKFTVLGFGNTVGKVNMWSPATSIEQMMVWIGEARSEFDNLGISTRDRNITITLDGANGNYGYVDSNSPVEKGGTLHLSDRNVPVDRMKASVAHEYFHHAQVKTILSGIGRNLLTPNTREEYNGRRWISEGTAMWFEDYLYDNLNDYAKYLSNPLEKILEKGISSIDNRYKVDLFWKLLSEKCTNFETNMKDIFYANFDNNLTRVNQVQRVLNASNCNFGNHLGDAKKASLESAIAYYQYATLYKDDVKLIDSNEDTTFKFQKTTYAFSHPWLNNMNDWLSLNSGTEYKLQAKESIPPVGAFSFFTKEITGDIPAGKIAVLKFESDKDIIISIVSPDKTFASGGNTIDAGNGSTDKHKWFKYSSNSSFIYEFSGKVPKLFVSLVNPSTTDIATNIKVTFEITDEVNHELTVTSHADGDEVNNRVITLQGRVPDEIKGLVDTIKVTNSGATTISTVNSNGTFSLGVVVTMGENIIKLQAFDGTEALTQTKLLTLTGIANSSSGQNALIPSRVAIVLQWKTNGTDIDLYSTDKNNGTLWYSNKTVSPGSLDYDNTSGYGPEVISYRKTDDSVYVDGKFDIDVHFYRGSTPTAYSLDVIMNETDSSNVRLRHYESKVSLSSGNSSQNGPSGSGNSRFNDLITVRCNTQRICSISNIATSKLSNITTAIETNSLANNGIEANTLSLTEEDETSYAKCIREYSRNLAKSGHVNWHCEEQTGKKIWE